MLEGEPAAVQESIDDARLEFWHGQLSCDGRALTCGTPGRGKLLTSLLFSTPIEIDRNLDAARCHWQSWGFALHWRR
jgi:hypothetical protein